MKSKETELAKKYGEKIRQLRQKAGLKQEEFAKKIGTSQTNVTRWESGNALISLLFLDKICKAFEVDMSYWNDGQEESPASRFESIRSVLQEFQQTKNHRPEPMQGTYTEIRLFAPAFPKGMQVHKNVDTAEIFLDAIDVFLAFGMNATEMIDYVDKFQKESE